MDVAVPRTNIREDTNGNPVLSFYVQFSSSVFLSADTLATAVMVGIMSVKKFYVAEVQNSFHFAKVHES